MKLNLDRLRSIQVTLEAIRDVDNIIKHYEDLTKSDPVYCSVETGYCNIEMQFDRAMFNTLIRTHKQNLINHLEDRFDGFEYDPDADWTGDHRQEEEDENLRPIDDSFFRLPT